MVCDVQRSPGLVCKAKLFVYCAECQIVDKAGWNTKPWCLMVNAEQVGSIFWEPAPGGRKDLVWRWPAGPVCKPGRDAVEGLRVWVSSVAAPTCPRGHHSGAKKTDKLPKGKEKNIQSYFSQVLLLQNDTSFIAVCALDCSLSSPNPAFKSPDLDIPL